MRGRTDSMWCEDPSVVDEDASFAEAMNLGSRNGVMVTLEHGGRIVAFDLEAIKRAQIKWAEQCNRAAS